MNKKEFLARLEKALSGLPQEEREERLSFYSEIIEDRMEEGLSEEQAVLAAGSLEEIEAQAAKEHALPKQEKTRRNLKGWEITLLAIGSPIWLSLGLAAISVVLSLYVALLSLLFSLWAVWVALVIGGFWAIFAGASTAFGEALLAGFGMIGIGLICAGLSIFFFIFCRKATKGMVWLTQKIIQRCMSVLNKKEGAQ